MESGTPSRDLASMHTDALSPEDKIDTFAEADAYAPGVETRTTFVSFGSIGRLNGGTTALTVKLRALTGPGGTREFFEVTHSPIANFDLHALADAAERARRFVGDARCVDFSTMFHSDWEAVAREVATKPEPYITEAGWHAPCEYRAGELERGPLIVSVGVDVADHPDRTVVTLVDFAGITPDGSRMHAERRVTRGSEIACWLSDHAAQIESIAILDDDDDMGVLTPWLVRTTFERGLQREHVEQAVELLARERDGWMDQRAAIRLQPSSR